ncbi:MAG TPA: hypothetical protein VKA70_22420 [Blastocatellia bacterium]|nr:hypothetical protein [Blastocatellia bacterium]
MSELYIRKLGRIRDEYDAAVGALAYVSANWHKQNIFNSEALETSSIEEVRRAAANLESTYLIHIFSVFEGILKGHLARNHPRIKVTDDVSAAWLIRCISGIKQYHINAQLRDKVHGVRKYRNYLVHQGGSMPAPVQLSEALARLTTFVQRLPDPR